MESYYKRNREKVLAYRKKYREKNKERIAEIKRKSRLRNLEKNKEKDRLRYEENKDKIKNNAKEYYYNNKDKILTKRKINREKLSEYAKQAYYNNPERRRKNILRSQTKKEYERGNIMKDKCNKCGSKEQLEFHHYNYNSWKNHIVLCKKCHLEAHNE
jgi:hypothetical protein